MNGFRCLIEKSSFSGKIGKVLRHPIQGYFCLCSSADTKYDFKRYSPLTSFSESDIRTLKSTVSGKILIIARWKQMDVI